MDLGGTQRSDVFTCQETAESRQPLNTKPSLNPSACLHQP